MKVNVNYHDRLVKALRGTLEIGEYIINREGYSGNPKEYVDARALLAELDEAARAQQLVKGDAVAMGHLTFEPDEHYENAVLVQFSSEDECRQAIQSGQCRFTVFGGEV